MRNEQPWDIPYYHPSVESHDIDGRESYRFISLQAGTISRSGFLREDTYYKALDDRLLLLPGGANRYFGVVFREDRKQDDQLTRVLFGGTLEEIESVAVAVAKIIGRRHHELVRLPRVTFSKSGINSCDLTNCLIPSDFPYIAFENSQYAWSHLSLHGFYKMLSFICSSDAPNPVREAILDEGIDELLLTSFIQNAEHFSPPLINSHRL